MIIDTSKVKAIKTVKPKKFDADKAVLEKVKAEQAGELSESEMIHLNLWTSDDNGVVWFW